MRIRKAQRAEKGLNVKGFHIQGPHRAEDSSHRWKYAAMPKHFAISACAMSLKKWEKTPGMKIFGPNAQFHARSSVFTSFEKLVSMWVPPSSNFSISKCTFSAHGWMFLQFSATFADPKNLKIYITFLYVHNESASCDFRKSLLQNGKFFWSFRIFSKELILKYFSCVFPVDDQYSSWFLKYFCDFALLWARLHLFSMQWRFRISIWSTPPLCTALKILKMRSKIPRASMIWMLKRVHSRWQVATVSNLLHLEVSWVLGYDYDVGEWAACDASCGANASAPTVEGQQSRTIRCIKTLSVRDTSSTVADSKCSGFGLPKPMAQKTCFERCDLDCIGSFSDYTSCSKCKNGRKQRTYSVSRQKAK